MRLHSKWTRCALLVCVVIKVTVGSPAAAEEFPVKVSVSETITHDDNVFRTSADPVADTLYSTAIRVNVDKTFSRQRLQALLSYSDNRYQNLDFLNNVSSNYLFAWQGAFPGSWNTDASWSRSENLVNFADVRSTRAKDIVTVDTARLRVGYQPHADWPVFVQRTHSTSSNSATSLAFNDLEVDSTEVGGQYNTPSGNQVAVVGRRTDGHYPNLPGFVGNNYRQQDLQTAITWKPGTKSAINFQFGRTHREQAGQPQRDFRGTTGRFTFEWAPTGVTSLNATVGREVSPITAVTAQDFSRANYAVVRSYGLGARWLPTAKVSAEARVNRQSRDINGTPADTTTTSSLALRYVPIRSVQVSLQINHDVRSSENPALVLPFKANTAVLSLSFSF